MQTTFYLFFKMHLEILSRVVGAMAFFAEKDDTAKINVRYFDSSELEDKIPDLVNDLGIYDPLMYPILLGNFSSPGEISIYSFIMGLYGVKVFSGEKIILDDELSPQSAARAITTFSKKVTSMTYDFSINSMLRKKESLEKEFDELDSKEEKNLNAINMVKSNLPILIKKIGDFENKFLKYKIA